MDQVASLQSSINKPGFQWELVMNVEVCVWTSNVFIACLYIKQGNEILYTLLV